MNDISIELCPPGEGRLRSFLWVIFPSTSKEGRD
jgi:hypothetical protein